MPHCKPDRGTQPTHKVVAPDESPDKKAIPIPLRHADNEYYDFTPSYVKFDDSRSAGGPVGLQPGPGYCLKAQHLEPRRTISITPVCDGVQLNKAEKAWKPAGKTSAGNEDPEEVKTDEMFRLLRSILNKLTPDNFQDLMKQVMDLSIDTEERLEGAVDLIFEKVLSEPNFSVVYANMCARLKTLKVSSSNKPEVFVNFIRPLLNRCQREFERVQDDGDILKEMEAAIDEEERECLKMELEEFRDKARRRSLGNMRFLGELFKLKMLTMGIMHDCIMALLKDHQEDSLEGLCCLISTAGKILDSEKNKSHVDQYFNHMDQIIEKKRTSSRICFMLRDVMDLRDNNWVPRRGDQGPKTIEQIHKDAEMEEYVEQVKVHHLLSQKQGEGDSRMGDNMGGRGSHTAGGSWTNQPQDEGWNKVPISMNRPVETSHHSNTTKPGSLDIGSIPLVPGQNGTKGDKGKGTGGTGAKPASGEPVHCESSSTPPPSPPALSGQQLERKMKVIIDEYLHLNDLQEALRCVTELNSSSLLYMFVLKGMESTLERRTKERDQMGLLLQQLVKEEVLSTEQYYKGLKEILKNAEDLAIDLPHIWLYLAELITPMLHGGGITIGQLFREISEPLVPQDQAGVLQDHILKLLCKQTEFTTGEEIESEYMDQKKVLTREETESEGVDKKKVLTGEEIESEDMDQRKVLTGTEIESEDMDQRKVLTGEEIESEDMDQRKVLTGEKIESEEGDQKRVLTGEEIESEEVDQKKVKRKKPVKKFFKELKRKLSTFCCFCVDSSKL